MNIARGEQDPPEAAGPGGNAHTGAVEPELASCAGERSEGPGEEAQEEAQEQGAVAPEHSSEGAGTASSSTSTVAGSLCGRATNKSPPGVCSTDLGQTGTGDSGPEKAIPSAPVWAGAEDEPQLHSNLEKLGLSASTDLGQTGTGDGGPEKAIPSTPVWAGAEDEPQLRSSLEKLGLSASTKLPEGLVQVGRVIAGKYRVERVVGIGGMGLVVAATHLQLGREVAVKLLRPDAVGSDSAVQRALGEAQAAAHIGSEHVTRVMDVGTLDGGKPYIVMEYLEGEDLSSLLARGPLPVETAVDYALQACEALAEAHNKGIVHCDLKPANLFVTRLADGSDCIKLMDFGIAKRAGPSGVSTGLTSHAGVVGSAHYMSPEQMQGTSVDARADIWSLGTLLYEMSTGHQTFVGDTWPEVCAAVFEGTATSMREWDASIPSEFEAVVARCLMRNPPERFATVGALAQALKPFASDAGRMSSERILRVLAGGARESGSPTQERTAGSHRRRSRLWAGVVVTGLCVVSVVALVLLQAERQPKTRFQGLRLLPSQSATVTEAFQSPRNAEEHTAVPAKGAGSTADLSSAAKPKAPLRRARKSPPARRRRKPRGRPAPTKKQEPTRPPPVATGASPGDAWDTANYGPRK